MPGHDLAKLFMGASTVGERGQVVIPVEVRERLGIKPGDKLLVLVHPDETGVSFVRFEKLQEAQQSLETVLLEYEHHGASTPEEGGRHEKWLCLPVRCPVRGRCDGSAGRPDTAAGTPAAGAAPA